jgi:enoyl-CoA hydratase
MASRLETKTVARKAAEAQSLDSFFAASRLCERNLLLLRRSALDADLARGHPLQIVTSSGESILLESTSGAVRTLTLNRPAQRNSLSPELISLLREALARADQDSAIRVVVLAASGDKAFCAGADLGSAASAADAGFVAAHESRRGYAQLLLDLDKLGKPTLAAANGAVLAGGLGILCACDFALAADDIKLGTPEVDVGLFPYMALAPILRCVGRRAAMELTMTGRKVTAQRAQALGLITEAVPRAELANATAALANLLAAKSPVTLRLGRRAFQIAESMPYAMALEALAAQLSLNALAEDAAEGIGAFLQKRTPDFSGR